MTREHFRKNAVSPEPINIFEFCKKHFIRNRYGSLTTKFQFMKLKNDFLNEYFQFSIRSRSSQGQGHFRKFFFIFFLVGPRPSRIYMGHRVFLKKSRSRSIWVKKSFWQKQFFRPNKKNALF